MDVRDVVRMKESARLEECDNVNVCIDEDRIEHLEECIRKYLPMRLVDLKILLSGLKVRGVSTFSHMAACVVVAESELETESMGTEDAAADDLFVLERDCGDQVSRLERQPPPETGRGSSATTCTWTGADPLSYTNLPILDREQRRAVEAAKSKSLTMINAGPGTGKTTTLSILVKEAVETTQSAKILFLSFTKRAEIVINERLCSMGLSDIIIDKTNLYHSPGICVLTFDRYAYTLTGEIFQSYSLGKQASLPHLRDLTRQGIYLLDYLIVDECQDLALVEYQMMKEVSKLSHRTVLAGDPRQECFRECSYFGKDWCSTEESDSNCKVNLVNNYRSCRCIVNSLNLFSKIHFPNIGGSLEQVSMMGKCPVEKAGEECIKVYDCRNNRSIAGAIAKHAAALRVDQLYVISPLSVKAYGNDLVVQAVNTCIAKDLYPNLPVAERARLQMEHNRYIIETSATLKGGEAEKVFLFGLDRTYPLDFTTRNRQLKLLYVALSRARTSIHIYLNYSGEFTPPLLHLALEGSVLQNRFTLGAGLKVIPRVVGREIPDGSLSMANGCMGLNKENQGGLSSCDINVEVLGEYLIGTTLDITQHVSVDTISRHLVSKALICEGLKLWISGVVSRENASTCAGRSVHSVGGAMRGGNIQWKANMSTLTEERQLVAMNKSCVQFGLSALSTLLEMCLAQQDDLHHASEGQAVDPSVLYGSNCGRFRPSEAESASNALSSQLQRLSLSRTDVSAVSDARAQYVVQECDRTIVIKCAPDILFSCGEYVIPVVLCTLSADIPGCAVTRAAICAAISSVENSAVINSTTGKLLVVKAADIVQIECIAKGRVLSKYVCEWSLQCIPVAFVPSLGRVTSVVILSTVRRSADSTALCALLMSNYSLTTAEKWELPSPNACTEGSCIPTELKAWMESRVREECTLLLYCDECTCEVLGDMLTNTDRAMSLTALFSKMADALLRTGSRCDVERLLRTEYRDALEWCVNLLRLTCCDFHEFLRPTCYHDTNIAVGCTVKSLMNWDTVV